MPGKPYKFVPLLVLAILALLAGLWAGLIRIGWNLPALLPGLPLQHGPLMVSGFLGTLIALERVAALRRGWMFAAPVFSGVGWLLGFALPSSQAGALFICLASAFFLAIMLVIVRREPRVYTAVMAAGAAAWLVGNLFWLAGQPVYRLVGWWSVYLVLTIAGERVELSRVLRLTRIHFLAFAAAAALLLSGAVLSAASPRPGAVLTGLGLLALSLWLVLFDLARRNLRHRLPLTRFISASVFSGTIWLGISGVLHLALAPQAAGPAYDAVLHSLFVGFVFAMIFGHAPMIFPALSHLPFRFHSGLYAPLMLLHASLILRVAADLAGWQIGRMAGGLLNEIAILTFIGLYAAGVLARQRELSAARLAARRGSE